ncbi:MAG TPA: hypothetical protein VMC80_00410 [Patescibacteria group bacterium]|nr:hypothetical protein [Patescibacteria group bacterium]
MVFFFKYKSVKLESGDVIYRPLIPLTLIGLNERLDIIAILDSGSDMSVIPKDVAEILGVRLLLDTELSGITKDKVKAKQGNISISFGKGRENYNLQIPILIPEKEDIPLVVGRIGFFDKFDITFSEKERKIIFKRRPEKLSYNSY